MAIAPYDKTAALAHAQQQLSQNKDPAKIQAWQNRVNSINAGTFDPSKVKSNPANRQATSGSVQKGALNAVQGFLTGSAAKPIDNSIIDPAQKQGYIDSAYNSLTKNFSSDFGRRRQELQDQLVNSGNPVGSPKYNDQMALLGREESDAKSAAQNQAQMTGADYQNQYVGNVTDIAGANNNTAQTYSGIQDMLKQQGFSKRQIDLMFQKLKRSGGGAAPVEESPFMTGPPPGYGG